MEKKHLKDLENIEKIAKIMDSQFKIPGTNITFGIDPIISLVPVVGDLLSAGISAYTVLAAARSGAGTKILLQMVGNFAFDALVGAVPILGDVFDFAFKANTRNVKILRQYYHEGKHTGSATPILGVVLMALVGILMLFGYVLYHIVLFLNDIFAQINIF